ncbi:MAG TPA: hypothetical protein GXZ82_02575 [Firmicutes bacterium]|nr:hypothetical protein [Bacillota bacterium]
MKRCLVVFIALAFVFSMVDAILAADGQVIVTSNILAESITRDRSGGARINRQILAFKAGRAASFQSLTTFMVPQPGYYSYRLVIVGPDNQPRAFYSDSMQTQQPDHLQQQITKWPNVNFNLAGVYQFIVEVNHSQIASFPIYATE